MSREITSNILTLIRIKTLDRLIYVSEKKTVYITDLSVMSFNKVISQTLFEPASNSCYIN